MRQSTLGTVFILGLKASLAFPFFFHTFVGFRHWSWDIFALGIRDMSTFYLTGYVALAAAAAFTAFVLICKSRVRTVLSKYPLNTIIIAYIFTPESVQ